jgi:hypothetical protein
VRVHHDVTDPPGSRHPGDRPAGDAGGSDLAVDRAASPPASSRARRTAARLNGEPDEASNTAASEVGCGSQRRRPSSGMPTVPGWRSPWLSDNPWLARGLRAADRVRVQGDEPRFS